MGVIMELLRTIGSFDEIQKNISYDFNNINLLQAALIHRSFAHENNDLGISSNERMEFLGDSILNVVVSDFLFTRFKDMGEGEMSKLRSELVCEDSLADVAVKINVKDSLFLGKGAQQENAGERKSIASDAIEAIIAAIYLDSGIESARKFIYSFILDDIDNRINEIGNKDKKTTLQNYLQRNGECKIEYKILEETGLAHEKYFVAGVFCNDELLAKGDGRSKKAAHQVAAGNAIKILMDENKL